MKKVKPVFQFARQLLLQARLLVTEMDESSCKISESQTKTVNRAKNTEVSDSQ